MGCRDDGGSITPAFIATVGLTVLLLVGAANQYAVHFARGVLQSAVEEGARQGRATGDPARCAARSTETVVVLLGGMAAHVGQPTCVQTAVGWTATLQASFPGWLPGLPAAAVTTTATASGGGGP